VIDSLLAWRMLNVNGILIWDDYEWSSDEVEGPKRAVDVVLNLFAGCFAELIRGSQIIVRKTADVRTYYAVRPALTPTPRNLLRFFEGSSGRARTPRNLLLLLLGRWH
jgi:hypothetical protein